MIKATMRAKTNAELEGFVFGLARASLSQQRERGGLPLLYDSGVVYVREPRGTDIWQTAVETLASGGGDCEDLCAYLLSERWFLAEKRLRGGDADALPRVRVTGPGMRHVTIVCGNGRVEDPSAKLGMYEVLRAARKTG